MSVVDDTRAILALTLLPLPALTPLSRVSEQAVDGGVEVEDVVHYALPFGWLGRLAHWLFVRRQLDAIFAHREAAMARRFPRQSPLPQPEAVPA